MATRKLPDGSTEFSNGGYTVIVKPDGAIKVKSGDSLSKYSKAIYDDFDRMDRRFGRMVGVTVKSFQELGANINLIHAGETIYHVHTYKVSKGITVDVDEQPNGIVEPFIPSLPPVTIPVQPPPASQLRFLLTWLKATAWPIPHLKFVSSAGGDLGIAMFTGQYFYMGLQDKTTNSNPEWFHGLGVGGSIGIDTGFPLDGTIAAESFPSTGIIFKTPAAGAVLETSDVCGNFILLEIGAALIGGVSVTIFMFGLKHPVEFALRTLYKILNGGSPIPSQFPFAFTGFVAMAGVTAGLSAGVALRTGMIQQSTVVTTPWNYLRGNL